MSEKDRAARAKVAAEKLYSLKLHQIMIVHEGKNVKMYATRVPGGWIYSYEYKTASCGPDHAVFVPYDLEFRDE